MTHIATITAERKGRKWIATGDIPAKSNAFAKGGGLIVRTAKADDPDTAAAAVQDALILASGQDRAAAILEQAEISADVERNEAEYRVRKLQQEREVPATVEFEVEI